VSRRCSSDLPHPCLRSGRRARWQVTPLRLWPCSRHATRNLGRLAEGRKPGSNLRCFFDFNSMRYERASFDRPATLPASAPQRPVQRHDPRQEPYAVIPARTDLCGGRRAIAVPTATFFRFFNELRSGRASLRDVRRTSRNPAMTILCRLALARS
jgi:hypothetical protein